MTQNNTWQPIESAPRDGTRILVWDGYTQFVAWWGERSLWSRQADAWVYGECGGEYNSLPEVDQPTHWMPLPEEPGKTS